MVEGEGVNDKELFNLIEIEKEKGVCIHNFRCSDGDFSKLDKVEEIGVSGFLVTYCHPIECKYAKSFGKEFLCSCPVRIYIARKYKK